MRRRRRFIVRGNFQLAFLAGVSALAALGVIAAAVANGMALAQVMERAAFLAHLGLRSSGELIGMALRRATLLVIGSGVVIGALVIAWGLWAQEALFHELVTAIGRLARGERSVRLAARRRWHGQSLVASFNAAAQMLDARAQQRHALLEEAQAVVQAEDPGLVLDRLAALQRALKQLEDDAPSP